MNNIYEQAKDLHVRKAEVYGSPSDHKLYHELTGTTYSEEVKKSESKDLFNKGILTIITPYGVMTPVGFRASDGVIFTLAKTGEPVDDFSATKTYAVGDCVFKAKVAYKCTTAISVAGAWDATNWTAIDTVNFVEWTSKADT